MDYKKEMENNKKEFLANLGLENGNFIELSKKIIDWAYKRKLIPGNVDKQTMKLIEETGELVAAILRDDRKKIIDGVGDCLVVIIILSCQLDINPESCLLSAWNEIKNRTGKTINGTFIKDEQCK